ncbi:DUF6146 family protein [Tenacibaculum jejuense]|uniref:Lipoprotein n=1 Tax=Tenacibaculum jejuense TaxID=584609 RepID=A0A238UDQ5_9FLAO|nr:DUF6146 family protein [Tenacibaculum jejuense]SNR17309.1 conserved exported protein of unknown function [Tenacibaculum jejuense]
MKKLLYYIFLSFTVIFVVSNCTTTKSIRKTDTKEEPVVIKNDSLEYEIIILDIGFNQYLINVAQPVGYYTQAYLENRNRFLVPIWNARVSNPTRFNPNIYQTIIDYDPHINYGYDVNYKLFHYFQFAQRKYRMSLR